MKGIWEEWARLKIIQRLSDQKRTIIKNGRFSDIEILEINRQINWETRQQYLKETETLNIEKQGPSYKKETNFNRNTTRFNTTEQILTQKEKTNTELIMSEKKTTLPSFSN